MGANEEQNKNWLARGAEAVRDLSGSPLGLAALLGGSAWLGTRALWNPAMRTLQSLGRPLAKATGSEKELDDYIQEQTEGDGEARDRVSAAAGLGTLAAALYLMYNPRYKYGGLVSWDREPSGNLKAFYKDPKPPKQQAGTGRQSTAALGALADLRKTAALGKKAFGMESYVNTLDWGRRVPLSSAQGLFTNDPFLSSNDRYSMNMGTAIVTDAAMRQNTASPTLGGIFDSAASKISNKLSLGGLASTATRAMVANGAARLFTGAVGAMFDLGPKARNTLVDAGTWAGTISSILN